MTPESFTTHPLTVRRLLMLLTYTPRFTLMLAFRLASHRASSSRATDSSIPSSIASTRSSAWKMGPDVSATAVFGFLQVSADFGDFAPDRLRVGVGIQRALVRGDGLNVLPDEDNGQQH